MSMSGLIGVLVGYFLFEPRRPEPTYYAPLSTKVPTSID